MATALPHEPDEAVAEDDQDWDGGPGADDDLDLGADEAQIDIGSPPCDVCGGSGVDSSVNDDGYQAPCGACGGTGTRG